MSIDDFCRCTPSEFAAIFEQWRLAAERSSRLSWEQARMICWAAVSPYAKKSLRPSDVMAFPWDDEKRADAPVDISKEEILERFEAAKLAYGFE